MSDPFFEFVPQVFWPVLRIVLASVVLGAAVVILVYGSITWRDVGGAMVSAVIFSYLLHLWIIPAREDDDPDGR